MNISVSALIVAEIGKQVGWGHVARAHILKTLLSPHMAVTVKVVNREPWNALELEEEFALNDVVDADIVFLDGLSLNRESDRFIRAPRKVSLSYISDVNDYVDLAIAPALNGMPARSHFITDLSAMLCNNPAVDSVLNADRSADNKTIGVCMGGGDADGVASEIVDALESRGFEAFMYPTSSMQKLSLDEFLKRKLVGTERQPFPYSSMKHCHTVICQGGLSAVELALMGMPTVIRRRTNFSDAYRFLYNQGCALQTDLNSIPAIIDGVEQIVEDALLWRRMSEAGKVLNARLSESFWLSLINKMMRK
jgi:spore coat polysaccharide biosynthesis predicted glycosyltransferase SpsG